MDKRAAEKLEKASQRIETATERAERVVEELHQAADERAKTSSTAKKKKPPVTDTIQSLLYNHPEWEHQPTKLTEEVNKKLKAQGHAETNYDTVKSTLTRRRNKRKNHQSEKIMDKE